MKRLEIDPRRDWKHKAVAKNFNYLTEDGTECWNENAVYEFSLEQIETLENATSDLHQMCLAIAQRIATNPEILDKMQIPRIFHSILAKVVQNDPLHLYGRFDLAYDGINPPKLLEYNADTPTGLYETGVWQWQWLEDQIENGVIPQSSDQFNSVHEKLIDRWKSIVPSTNTIYFTCMQEFEEDRGTVLYLEDTAVQAGFNTKFIDIADIGLDNDGYLKSAYDLQGFEIKTLFKLYPWEWLAADAFSVKIPDMVLQWVEPIWKMILSNKAILPLLWDVYPNHPNLLPAYFEGESEGKLGKRFIKKPFYSREGANITLVDGDTVHTTDGVYGKEGYIVQAVADIPIFYSMNQQKHAIIGSWVIGDDPAGIIIRESNSLVTDNLSQIVPHIIKDF